jgi:hypothetical protein
MMLLMVLQVLEDPVTLLVAHVADDHAPDCRLLVGKTEASASSSF